MTEPTTLKDFGLKPQKKDDRRFAAGAFITFPKLSELPKEGLGRAVLKIKDQISDGYYDYCPGYGSTGAREFQEFKQHGRYIELCPHYIFGMGKYLAKDDPNAFGLTLDGVCQAWVKAGTIEEKDHTMELGRDGSLYPEELKEKAAPWKAKAYFEAVGPYDTFDNIRALLYKFRDKGTTVIVGADWRYDWESPTGLIAENYGDKGSGHLFNIFDFGILGTHEVLFIQNSIGEKYGDHGIYYMTRKTCNRELGPRWGTAFFEDMPEGATKDDMIELSKRYRFANLSLLEKLWHGIKWWGREIIK